MSTTANTNEYYYQLVKARYAACQCLEDRVQEHQRLEWELQWQADTAKSELEERHACYRLLQEREGMLAAEVVGEKRGRAEAEARVMELEGRVGVLQMEFVEATRSRVQEVGELEGRLLVLGAEVEEEKIRRGVIEHTVSGLEDKVELLKAELREEQRSAQVNLKEKDDILDAHRRW